MLTLRTTSEIKTLLRLAAERERRSVASMVEVLVLNHAKQHRLGTGTPRAIPPQVLQMTRYALRDIDELEASLWEAADHPSAVSDGRGDLLKGDKHWQYGMPTVCTGCST